MTPKFKMYVSLPTGSIDENLLGIRMSDRKTVSLTIRDILRTAFYYEDPNDENKTVVKIEDAKIIIPVRKEEFEFKLFKMEQDELFRTINLN